MWCFLTTLSQSKDGLEFEMCLRPAGPAWQSCPIFQYFFVGAIYHLKKNSFDTLPGWFYFPVPGLWGVTPNQPAHYSTMTGWKLYARLHFWCHIQPTISKDALKHLARHHRASVVLTKQKKKSKTGQQIVSRAKKKPTQKITRNNVAKTSSSWLSPAKISATTWVLVPKRTKLRDHNTGFLQKQIYGTNYASRTVWSMRFVLWIYNQVQDMFQFSYLTHRISEMSSDRRWRCWWAVGNLALSLHRTWPPDECLFPWIQIFFKVVVWCSDTLLFQGYQP